MTRVRTMLSTVSLRIRQFKKFNDFKKVLILFEVEIIKIFQKQHVHVLKHMNESLQLIWLLSL